MEGGMTLKILSTSQLRDGQSGSLMKPSSASRAFNFMHDAISIVEDFGELDQKLGRWRSRRNRARQYCDEDGRGEFFIGFREVPHSEWYEVPFPFMAHAEPLAREIDYESSDQVDCLSRLSQSFTNRLRSINWRYYLGTE